MDQHREANKHPYSHLQIHLELPIKLSLWTEGGSWSSWREPMHTERPRVRIEPAALTAIRPKEIDWNLTAISLFLDPCSRVITSRKGYWSLKVALQPNGYCQLLFPKEKRRWRGERVGGRGALRTKQ